MAGRRPERHPARRPLPRRRPLRRRIDAPEGRIGTRLAMARRPALLSLLLLALAAAPGVAGSAGERFHRLHVPPPPVVVLPHSLAVDEFEWGMRGTHLEVKAGVVRIHVYNRGMDDHDLTLVDAHGQVHSVPLVSGEDAVLEAD